MIRLAANLSFLFTEVAFEARVESAAAAGFRGVECLFPYDIPEDALAHHLRDADVELALFNAPAGDWANGERGIAALEDRRGELHAGLEVARAYALATGCTRVHVLAGRHQDGAALPAYLRGLQMAVEILAPVGVDVLVEPLNPFDFPGYLITSADQVRHLVEVLGDGVRLQADLYHLARQGIGPVTALAGNGDLLGHVQVAGPPHRFEPTPDRIDVLAAFDELERQRYPGWVGCEYNPEVGTSTGLTWAARWLEVASSRAEGSGS